MPDNEPVARGDRRADVWIEDDKDQKTKVRHTFPSRPPVEEVAESVRAGASADDAEVTDTAVTPESPSAWEALEEGD
ncbi:MAG: hypothetical protein ACM3W4_04445 [Ignavibacteriales bacterium]